jgi:hypothetical protein
MCFVWISEQTAIISPYNINWLVFITERARLLRDRDWKFLLSYTLILVITSPQYRICESPLKFILLVPKAKGVQAFTSSSKFEHTSLVAEEFSLWMCKDSTFEQISIAQLILVSMKIFLYCEKTTGFYEFCELWLEWTLLFPFCFQFQVDLYQQGSLGIVELTPFPRWTVNLQVLVLRVDRSCFRFFCELTYPLILEVCIGSKVNLHLRGDQRRA